MTRHVFSLQNVETQNTKAPLGTSSTLQVHCTQAKAITSAIRQYNDFSSLVSLVPSQFCFLLEGLIY